MIPPQLLYTRCFVKANQPESFMGLLHFPAVNLAQIAETREYPIIHAEKNCFI